MTLEEDWRVDDEEFKLVGGARETRWLGLLFFDGGEGWAGWFWSMAIFWARFRGHHWQVHMISCTNIFFPKKEAMLPFFVMRFNRKGQALIFLYSRLNFPAFGAWPWSRCGREDDAKWRRMLVHSASCFASCLDIVASVMRPSFVRQENRLRGEETEKDKKQTGAKR